VPNPFGNATGPRAGFWRRFAGLFIDGIIVAIPSSIVDAALRSAGQGLAILIAGAYFTYFIGATRGQTPGQSAMGIRCISLADGAPIGYGRAFIRWIGSYLSLICFGLGYLWMLWDREKQCWHDKFAGSVVVPVSAYPPPR
jgi:uncharacterized RDD family membrane protein YckC